MNILTKRISWAYWQFGLLKLCTISFGIILGSYFADFWRPIISFVWIIFIVTYVLAIWMWFREARK